MNKLAENPSGEPTTDATAPTEEEAKEEESKTETNEEGEEEKKSEDAATAEESKVVDTAKINALNKMLDDFENILSKNFCQFANYEDFSFAKSRTTEALQD